MMWDLITWPIYHEQTFWTLIFVFIFGIVAGRGAHGHWRTWFDFDLEEKDEHS